MLNVHRESLIAVRNFWRYLLSSRVSLTTLTDQLKKVDKAILSAERVYKQVLLLHPDSARLIKLYANFLYDIQSDPSGYYRWSSEAEKLELAAEENKESAFGTATYETAIGGAKNPFALRVQDERAVIVMSAQCIILKANPGAYNLFLYDNGRNELRAMVRVNMQYRMMKCLLRSINPCLSLLVFPPCVEHPFSPPCFLCSAAQHLCPQQHLKGKEGRHTLPARVCGRQKVRHRILHDAHSHSHLWHRRGQSLCRHHRASAERTRDSQAVGHAQRGDLLRGCRLCGLDWPHSL